MEIALGGLVILLILLPGISYRRGYFSGEFSNQYTNKDFFQLFVNTLFPSIIGYLIFLPLIYCLGYTYNLQVLLGILSSEETLVQYSVKEIDFYKIEIIVFQISLNISAFLVGLGFRNLIVGKSYDTKSKFFRYKNIWHYLLSGKFMMFKRSQIELLKNKIEDVDITYVDALLVVGEEAFIYTGILVDYELSNEGGLDLLYLRDAQRKKVNATSETKTIDSIGEDTEYHNISGHIIILKYQNIINLNLSFIQVEVSKDSNEVEFVLIS